MSRRFIKTPILDRLVKTLRSELDGLSDEELILLNKECKKVTDFNCEFQRKRVADMYGSHVSAILHNKIID
mgnify:CR=1 FL=1